MWPGFPGFPGYLVTCPDRRTLPSRCVLLDEPLVKTLGSFF